MRWWSLTTWTRWSGCASTSRTRTLTCSERWSRVFAERLMSAEVDSLCGAGFGEVSPDRVNSRNGYRPRDFDTRVGSIDLAIPKLRSGSYFPDWLLEPRRRAERALTQVIAECYVRGVSTRRVEGLVKTLGIERLSKSQVSRMAKDLDKEVEAFRTRPLDGGPYAYVWLDATVQKSERPGAQHVAVVIATGVGAEGHREVLGMDVFTPRTEPGGSPSSEDWSLGGYPAPPL